MIQNKEHPSDALFIPQISKPDKIIKAKYEFLGNVRSEDNTERQTNGKKKLCRL